MQPAGIQLSNLSVEPQEGGVVALRIEVAPSAVLDARNRAIKEFSKRIRIPGFRPGSIPAGIVRRNVGDEAIAQEVSDQLVPAAYQAAIAQSGVTPLDQAQVDDLVFDAFDNDKPFSFVARVIARPEVTIGSTEGLAAVKRSVNISDEDVQQSLGQMQQERAYLKNKKEEDEGGEVTAQMADVIFADVQVFVNGEPRSEEPAKLRGFVLGESGFVPAIDDKLVGQKLDESRRFSQSYPEDFPDPELAGKEADFEVKVTAIKERVIPEVTDEFAQISGADSVADLHAKLRDYLAATGEREARKDAREEVVKQVVDKSEVAVPAALVSARVTDRVAGIEQELGQNGATIEAYLQAINSTQEQLEGDLREEIENELKTELVLDEIARGEKFPVSQDEVGNHYMMMAQMSGTDPQQLVKDVPYQSVVTSILQRKAIDFLADKAAITDESGQPVQMSAGALEDENEEVMEEVMAEEAMMDAMDEDGEMEAGDVVMAEGGDLEPIA